MISTKGYKVNFYREAVRVTIRNPSSLKRHIERLFRKEGRKLLSLSYVFCTDSRLLGINKEWLNHDYYTDIISFDLSSNPSMIEGEVYISIDRVRENAITLGIPLSAELRRVIFHGALHLCGYQDKTKSDRLKMRKMEDLLLSKSL